MKHKTIMFAIMFIFLIGITSAWTSSEFIKDQTKIDEKIESFKKIEDRKNAISIDIAKLEETMEKLQKAISNPDLDSEAVKKLTGIRESIEASIVSLKNDYVGLDLFKRDI
jgi:predicted  nucleic acid-binding Zn-ribbon protein